MEDQEGVSSLTMLSQKCHFSVTTIFLKFPFTICVVLHQAVSAKVSRVNMLHEITWLVTLYNK